MTIGLITFYFHIRGERTYYVRGQQRGLSPMGSFAGKYFVTERNHIQNNLLYN